MKIMRKGILRKDMVLAVVVFMALTVSPTVTSVLCVQGEITRLYEMENAMELGSGKILIVDDEGDCIEGYDCYTCIQDAINFPDDGDEIRVCSGTYYENIQIKGLQQLKLVGNSTELGEGNDIGKPVIDGRYNWEGVVISGCDGCSLSNFTIQNSRVEGILIQYSSNITISENHLKKREGHRFTCFNVYYNNK
jgi:parallel beta-helix repeat protein